MAGPAPAGSRERTRAPSPIPNVGPSGHREKGSATQSGRDSRILKSKRNIRCRHRLAPSSREGETQEAAGPASPLKDREPLSGAVTAPLPGSKLPCTGYPSLSGPPRSCAEFPSSRLPGDSGEHRQRGAGAEKAGYRGRTLPTCPLEAPCLGSSCGWAHSGQLVSPLLLAPKGLGSPDRVPQKDLLRAPDKEAELTCDTGAVVGDQGRVLMSGVSADNSDHRTQAGELGEKGRGGGGAWSPGSSAVIWRSCT